MASTVSIVMATYNGGRYLSEQLCSIEKQSRLPDEMVVTDDGSTDETLSLLETFQKSAPFNLTIHQNASRLGYGENFLRAVALCKGDLICFADQDDIWLPSKIARCLEAFDLANPSVVVHSAEVVGPALQPWNAQYPTIRRDTYSGPFHEEPFQLYPGFAMCVDRRLFQLTDNVRRPLELGGDVPMAHDAWAGFLAPLSQGVFRLAEPLALHRRHYDNVTGPIAPKAPPSRFHLAISTDVAEAAAEYARLATVAFERADFLTDLALETEVGTGQRCYAWAQAHRRLGKLLELRSELYGSASGRRRYRILYRIVRGCGYSTRVRGGFSHAQFAKDFGVASIYHFIPHPASLV